MVNIQLGQLAESLVVLTAGKMNNLALPVPCMGRLGNLVETKERLEPLELPSFIISEVIKILKFKCQFLMNPNHNLASLNRKN